MKKLFFLLSFMALGAITTLHAQEATSTKKSCAKTCTKSKKSCAKSAATTSVASAVMTADEAAKANENIERRQCAKTGNVSYYEKSTCPMSGKTSYTHVNYDDAQGMFVSASAEVAEPATKKSCSKTCAKKCSKKKAMKPASEGASS